MATGVTFDQYIADGGFFRDLEGNDLAFRNVLTFDPDVVKITHFKNVSELVGNYFQIKDVPFFDFYDSPDGILVSESHPLYIGNQCFVQDVKLVVAALE